MTRNSQIANCSYCGLGTLRPMSTFYSQRRGLTHRTKIPMQELAESEGGLMCEGSIIVHFYHICIIQGVMGVYRPRWLFVLLHVCTVQCTYYMYRIGQKNVVVFVIRLPVCMYGVQCPFHCRLFIPFHGIERASKLIATVVPILVQPGLAR